MKAYIDHIRKLSGLNKFQELEAGRLYVDSMLKRAENYFTKPKKVFTTTMVPSEILLAFDVASLDSEEVAPIIESMGSRNNTEAEKCIKAAVKLGLSEDVCPYPLTTIGAFERGLIAVPDAFIGSSYMCNDQYEMIKFLAYRYNKPYFIIDIPCWHDKSTIDYVEEQLKELVKFLSNILDKPLDYECFVKTMDCSNDTYLTTEGIKEKRCQGVNIPGSEFIYFYGTQVLSGHLDNLSLLEKLYEECSDRLDTQQRIRAFWMNVLPLRKKSVVRSLEKDYGIDIAYDELSTCNMAPVKGSDPFRSLAEKLLSGIYLNGIERRIKNIKRMIKDYKIDIAMGFSYSRCKLTSGGMSEIKHLLHNEQIPYVEWNVQSISGNEISTERIRNDVENLVHISSMKRG